MSTAPQHVFTVVLPTTDTGGNTLTAGEMTSLVFQITPAGGSLSSYNYTLPANTAGGATVSVLFSALAPAFVPAPGVSYSADVFAVDAGGNGVPSATATWTETAAVPEAPTGFSVA